MRAPGMMVFCRLSNSRLIDPWYWLLDLLCALSASAVGLFLYGAF